MFQLCAVMYSTNNWISSQRDCGATLDLDTMKFATFTICLCKKVFFKKCPIKDSFCKSDHICLHIDDDTLLVVYLPVTSRHIFSLFYR